eukprot:IDg20800t1
MGGLLFYSPPENKSEDQSERLKLLLDHDAQLKENGMAQQSGIECSPNLSLHDDLGNSQEEQVNKLEDWKNEEYGAMGLSSTMDGESSDDIGVEYIGLGDVPSYPRNSDEWVGIRASVENSGEVVSYGIVPEERVFNQNSNVKGVGKSDEVQKN